MQHYSMREAAQQLGITRQGVHWHIIKGHLKAKKVGNVYIITQTDLEKFKKK